MTTDVMQPISTIDDLLINDPDNYHQGFKIYLSIHKDVPLDLKEMVETEVINFVRRARTLIDDYYLQRPSSDRNEIDRPDDLGSIGSQQ